MSTNTTIESPVQEAEIVPIEQHQLEERSVQEVIAQIEKIQTLMKSVLRKDEHYGIIPGTKKPSLYKAGAEKLCFTFRLLPKFTFSERGLENGHREYTVTCDLFHTNGSWCGQGVGSCSTMESKYRWRRSERVCPSCGADAIRKSNYPDKNTGEKGWYCNKKADGCGSQFQAGAPEIEEQETGKKENPDIADVYNTCLKIAKKRAHVDSTITTTAASDIFTQDLEDLPDSMRPAETPREPERKPDQDQSESKKGGRKATQKQIKMLWAKAGERAEKTGIIREEIMRAVLEALNLEQSKDIPAAAVDEMVQLINDYEPSFQPNESGEEGAEDGRF